MLGRNILFGRVLFILFSFFICTTLYSSAVDAVEGCEHTKSLTIYQDTRITIKKVTDKKAFEQLAALENIDEHLENLHYCLKSPLGVYIAYETANMIPVAIQSFGEYTKGALFMAAAKTNVLKAYQGLKYGSEMRKRTAEYISTFFGKPIQIDYEKLSGSPLLCIASSNEWFFGENYPSLKSALNAGYGIVSIAHFGTAEMRYPNDGSLWNSSRIAAIIEFSKIMMTPSDALASVAVSHMIYLLTDLDFSKTPDITTLLSVAERVIRIVKPDSFEGPDYVISPEGKRIYQAVYDESLSKVFEQIDSAKQQQLKDFVARGEYAEWRNFKGVLEHFKIH